MQLRVAVLVAMTAVTDPATAQDASETVYMGIDLTAEPEPVQAPPTPPQRRSVAADTRALLDEGVDRGCLLFDPPTSFSQSADRGEECVAYIARLSAATSPESEEATAPPVPPSRLGGVPLVKLAIAAQSGNKEAQLELGMRFEEGRGGVEIDLERALELYQEAARSSTERRALTISLVPDPLGGPDKPRLEVVTSAPRRQAAEGARDRLEALEARLASESIEIGPL